MKKAFFILGMAAVISSCGGKHDAKGNGGHEHQHEHATEHTGAIDYNFLGTYKGITPCETCPGVDTSLALYNDGTFEMSQSWLDGEENSTSTGKGDYSYDKSTKILALLGDEGEQKKFVVSEGQLEELNDDNKPYEGDEAGKYILKIQK